MSDPATAGIAVGAFALILFGAAWQKFSEPNAFLAALAGYRLVPDPLLGLVTRAVPSIEIALGLGLLWPATRSLALIGTSTLLLVYALSIAVNLVRGRSYIDCGCGGMAQPLSWALVARNGVLAAAAGAVSGPTVQRSFDWLDTITLVAGALAFYIAYLMVDELLRQADRMARTEEEAAEAGSTPI